MSLALKDLFTFIPSSDPQVEDDMYQFVPDENYHIQVGEDRKYGVVIESDEGFQFKPAHNTLQEAMSECAMLHQNAVEAEETSSPK